MTIVIARVGILLAVLALAWLGVALLRQRIALWRRLALAAPPLPRTDGSAGAEVTRILAFSTKACTQCHTLQAPALDRVRVARPGRVEVVAIDALAAPELADRYHVITVPSTVVLDSTGRAIAVNYGYADARTLLAQVDKETRNG
jgi:hypothetical protein